MVRTKTGRCQVVTMLELNTAELSLLDYEVCQQTADSIEVRSSVPRLHPHMDGHFDEFKVLPAVSQVAFILDVLSHYLGKKIKLKSVTRSKFRSMVRPGAQVTLKIRIEGGHARWVLQDDKLLYSRGLVAYE